MFSLCSNSLRTCHGNLDVPIVRNVVGDHLVACTRPASARPGVLQVPWEVCWLRQLLAIMARSQKAGTCHRVCGDKKP
jgi:hypothetical protein